MTPKVYRLCYIGLLTLTGISQASDLAISEQTAAIIQNEVQAIKTKCDLSLYAKIKSYLESDRNTQLICRQYDWVSHLTQNTVEPEYTNNEMSDEDYRHLLTIVHNEVGISNNPIIDFNDTDFKQMRLYQENNNNNEIKPIETLRGYESTSMDK